MSKSDYYEILGCSKTASEAELKKAFRSKAKELHPDRNAGNSSATEKFKKVMAFLNTLGQKGLPKTILKILDHPKVCL